MNQSADELLQSAKEMASQGADDRTITFAMADQGIPDELIDETIAQLKKFRKSLARARGRKELLVGGSIVAVGIILAIVVNSSEMEYGFAFYLVPLGGLSLAARGLVRIMIP